MKKVVSMLLMVVLILGCFSISFADSKEGNSIVCLGKDLNKEQRKEVLSFFGYLKEEDANIIEVTNEEERAYLGDYIDSKQLGTRSISSVYVEILREGSGVQVETNNIIWVTDYMFQNALVTAGIKDAKIVVTAPFEVSGTAALTGIIKAFEDVTGENISEDEKNIASEEIAITSQLGDSLGKEDAENLLTFIKTEVVEKGITDENKIRKAVINASKKLDVELTDEEVDNIVRLMKNISTLDLDIEQIKNQIKGIQEKLALLNERTKEMQNILVRIWNFLVNLFKRFLD